MAEDVKNGNTGADTKQGKTFTQEELDRIVQDRLSREREKFADYETLAEKAKKFDEAEEANKSEMEKLVESRDTMKRELESLQAEVRMRSIQSTVAEAKGVPVSLLTASTQEECEKQADAILDFVGSKKAGTLKVRDTHEQNPQGGNLSTREQFAEIFNKL